MIATLGALGFSVAAGLTTEAVIRQAESSFEPDELEYVNDSVKRAASNTHEKYEPISFALLEVAFEEKYPGQELDTIHTREATAVVTELAKFIVEQSDMESIEEAEEAVRYFLTDLERQIARDPSRGLPIIVNYLSTAEEQLESIDEDVADIREKLGSLHEDLQSDFVELRDQTEDALDQQSTPAGIDSYLERDKRIEIEQELRAGHSILIVGHAGVGKSTLLRQIVSDWNGPRYLLQADRLGVQSSAGLREAIGLTKPLKRVLRDISDSETSVLVAIDQLDSVHDTQAEDTYRDLLRSISRMDNVVSVCTQRQWEIDEIGSIERLVEDNHLKKVSVGELSSSAVGDALRKIGIEDPSEELVQLCQRPLELSIVAELVTYDEELDTTTFTNRVSIWRAYEDYLKSELSVGDEPHYRDVFEAAALLAKQSYLDDREYATSDKVEPESLQALDRLGIISKTHPQRQFYEFRHSQFRAYFYASKQTSYRNDGSDLPTEFDEYATAEVLAWMLVLFDYNDERDEEAVFNLMDSILGSGELNIFEQSLFLEQLVNHDPRTLHRSTLDYLVEKIEAEPRVLRKKFASMIGGQWILPLHRSGFFDPLTKEGFIQVLLDVWPDHDEKIWEVLSDVRPLTEVQFGSYISLLKQAPTEQQPVIVEQMLTTLSEEPLWQAGAMESPMFDLLESLMESNLSESAAKLLRYALYSREKGNFTLFVQDHTFVTSHFNKYTEQYRDEALIPFIDTLENALAADFERRFERDALTPPEDGVSSPFIPDQICELSPEDGSSYMPDNENGTIRYQIVAALRDALVEATQLSNECVHDRLQKYCNAEQVFVRIAICIIKEHPETYPDLAVEVLTDPQLRQYFLVDLEPLLTATAPVLSDKQAAEILEAYDEDLSSTFESTTERDQQLYRALSKANSRSESLPEPFSDRLEKLDKIYLYSEHSESDLKREDRNTRDRNKSEQEQGTEEPTEQGVSRQNSSDQRNDSANTTLTATDMFSDSEGFYEKLAAKLNMPEIEESETNPSLENLEELAEVDPLAGFTLGRNLPRYIENGVELDDLLLEQLLSYDNASADNERLQYATACGLISVCLSNQSAQTVQTFATVEAIQRIEPAILRVCDLLDDLSDRVISGPLYGLGEWIVFIAIVDVQPDPSELQIIERFSALADQDDSRPKFWLVPDGFRRLMGSERLPTNAELERLVDLWQYRVPSDPDQALDWNSHEYALYLDCAKHLIEQEIVPPKHLIENTIRLSDEVAWYYLEEFLTQYITVRPEHALQIYRKTAETTRDAKGFSKPDLATCILQQGLEDDDEEVVRLANEVTQEIAKITENEELLDLLRE